MNRISSDDVNDHQLKMSILIQFSALNAQFMANNIFDSIQTAFRLFMSLDEQRSTHNSATLIAILRNFLQKRWKKLPWSLLTAIKSGENRAWEYIQKRYFHSKYFGNADKSIENAFSSKTTFIYHLTAEYDFSLLTTVHHPTDASCSTS